MINFSDIVVLVPQNKNQFVKLNFQFLNEGLVIYATADKGEEGLDASLELMESLHNHLQQHGITHEVYELNCGRIDRIDSILIRLAPLSEPVLLKERDYSYVAMKPDRRKKVSDGSEVKGVISARNTSEAINKLRNMGYFPIDVKSKK